MGVAVKTMSGKRDKGRGLTTRGARIKRLEARLETEKDERILEAIRAQLAAFGRGRVGSVYTRALIATPAYKRLRLAIAHAALTLGPVLDEPVLDRLIGEIAMHDRTLDDELEEVFAHERERERGRAPRPEVKTFRTTWRIPAEPAARRLIDADAQDALASRLEREFRRTGG